MRDTVVREEGVVQWFGGSIAQGQPGHGAPRCAQNEAVTVATSRSS